MSLHIQKVRRLMGKDLGNYSTLFSCGRSAPVKINHQNRKDRNGAQEQDRLVSRQTQMEQDKNHDRIFIKF